MCFQFCRYGQPLVPMAPGTRYNLLMAAKVDSRCCAWNTAIVAFEPPGPSPWSCSLRPVKQRAVHECSPQQWTGAISNQPCGCSLKAGSMGWQLSLITDSTPGDDTPVRAIGHRSSACMQAGRLCGPGQYHMAGIYQSNRKHQCSG